MVWRWWGFVLLFLLLIATSSPAAASGAGFARVRNVDGNMKLEPGASSGRVEVPGLRISNVTASNVNATMEIDPESITTSSGKLSINGRESADFALGSRVDELFADYLGTVTRRSFSPILGHSADVGSSGAGIGAWAALALQHGSGHPVFAHFQDPQGLVVTVCLDPLCQNFVNRTVDAAAHLGSATRVALALTSDNSPVFAYHNASPKTLNLCVCGDAMCSSSTVTVVHSPGVASSDIGEEVAIALISGLVPVMSYRDSSSVQSDNRLLLATCSSLTSCGSPTIKTLDTATSADSRIQAGGSSLLLRGGTVPLVAYLKSDAGVQNPDIFVKLAICADAACSSHETRTLSAVGARNFNPHIRLSPSTGYPVVASRRGIPNPATQLIRCEDAACTTWTTKDVAVSGHHLCMALDLVDRPAFIWRDSTLNYIYSTKCRDSACDRTVTRIISNGVRSHSGAHGPQSCTLTGSNQPVIAFAHNSGARVVFCGDNSCL